ncbi:hypothetical protein IZY60_12720 [Lutibacter sp. B2]|nr:hypothetical protein [Lutibacter sp. B2]
MMKFKRVRERSETNETNTIKIVVEMTEELKEELWHQGIEELDAVVDFAAGEITLEATVERVWK